MSFCAHPPSIKVFSLISDEISDIVCKEDHDKISCVLKEGHEGSHTDNTMFWTNNI